MKRSLFVYNFVLVGDLFFDDWLLDAFLGCLSDFCLFFLGLLAGFLQRNALLLEQLLLEFALSGDFFSLPDCVFHERRVLV